jgi:hypothetical protein
MRRRTTGNGTDTMEERNWLLLGLVGRPVWLEIADLSSDAWGHINVDDIVEFWDPVADTETALPSRVVLHANAPNPFNPGTLIRFDLVESAHAQLTVFDVRGRLIRTLVDAPLGPGRHEVRWNGAGADGALQASGVYYYRLVAGSQTLQRSMQLLK